MPTWRDTLQGSSCCHPPSSFLSFYCFSQPLFLSAHFDLISFRFIFMASIFLCMYNWLRCRLFAQNNRHECEWIVDANNNKTAKIKKKTFRTEKCTRNEHHRIWCINYATFVFAHLCNEHRAPHKRTQYNEKKIRLFACCWLCKFIYISSNFSIDSFFFRVYALFSI